MSMSTRLNGHVICGLGASDRCTIAIEVVPDEDKLAVRDWMGHTSLATTERYGRVRSSALARRMRRGPEVQQAGEERATNARDRSQHRSDHR